jgi:UDP:flavonoid glycosyltransferase YjiC (YdhE family)
MRVLITTAPLHGHLFPLVPLAWALRAAGHEVLVATPENFVGEVVAAGLPGVPSAGPVGFAEFMLHDRGGNPVSPPADPAARRASSGRAWGRLAARTLAGTRDLVARWRPDLVVSEPVEYAGPMAAASHGIPWVEHWWGLAVQPEYRPAAGEELAGELAALGLATLPDPALRIDVCPPTLQRPGVPVAVPMRYVPYSGTAVVPAWVREPASRPRICLTLGSMLPRHGRRDFAGLLRAMVAELTGTGAEVLVAVEDEVARGWPDLPDGVRAVGWLPLALVLPACDAVVHHGGPGSVFTALTTGTPQLALPQTADQFENADRMAGAGAGARLLPAECSPAAVAAACADLVADPLYRKNTEALRAENAARPSPAEVVAVLERLAPTQPSRR